MVLVCLDRWSGAYVLSPDKEVALLWLLEIRVTGI
jgi:hypothetical protein